MHIVVAYVIRHARRRGVSDIFFGAISWNDTMTPQERGFVQFKSAAQ
jgi:hypothetical protein